MFLRRSSREEKETVEVTATIAAPIRKDKGGRDKGGEQRGSRRRSKFS